VAAESGEEDKAACSLLLLGASIGQWQAAARPGGQRAAAQERQYGAEPRGRDALTLAQARRRGVLDEAPCVTD
jgi:hypothetical protein